VVTEILGFLAKILLHSCLADHPGNQLVCNLNTVHDISVEAYIQSFICEFTVVVEILRCQFRRFGGLGVAGFGDVAGIGDKIR
jgi:hypothetical protein